MQYNEIKTPAYIIDEKKLIENLKILEKLRINTGVKILLAQKAFSCYHFYPIIGRYIDGTTASGIYEAKLGAECMGKETHIYSPAFQEKDMEDILEYSDHIVFNSINQLLKYGVKSKEKGLQVGLRINPEYSTQEGHEIYDPCAKYSRLGVTHQKFENAVKENPTILSLLDGLHFHTLCEQDADALDSTLNVVEKQFGYYFPQLKWINFGGGHHITKVGYQLEILEKCINHMQETYHLQVYLEPGEAIAFQAGYLYTKVIEILENELDIAILDTSAACHMPDVLEMPYRPPLRSSGKEQEKEFKYRLAGPTCLAGDIIGDYSFDHKLTEGELLIFEDMAIYSMVKNNTFNGMPLPSIYKLDVHGQYHLLKEFQYHHFKERL